MKLEKITTLKEALIALAVDGFDRKTRAILLRDRFYPKGTSLLVTEYYIEEYFDDGRGHSNAFSSNRRRLSGKVALELLRGYYVEGLLKPGYTSDREYKLSRWGRDKLNNLLRDENGTNETSYRSS